MHNFSKTLTADSVCKVNARRNKFHKIKDIFDTVIYCQGSHDHIVVEPRHIFNNIIMPVRYILSSVWVSFSIFSQLSTIQHMGLCVFSLPISLVVIEREYILCFIFIIKSKVWTIIHRFGLGRLGRETMVCAVCLSIFLFRVIYPGAAQSYNCTKFRSRYAEWCGGDTCLYQTTLQSKLHQGENILFLLECTTCLFCNRPISHISQCIRHISHNTQFKYTIYMCPFLLQNGVVRFGMHNAPPCSRNVHTCAYFCYKMVHCAIFVWCIVGFVRWDYSYHRSCLKCVLWVWLFGPLGFLLTWINFNPGMVQ